MHDRDILEPLDIASFPGYSPRMAVILSIEDDALLQQAFGAALYKAGYEIHYAFQGKEGYDKILSLHPDLVLLDLMLPMMNGLDILKQMRLHPELRAIPVIMMTAMIDDENKIEQALKQQSSVKYLRKPFHINELVDLINRTLHASPFKNRIPPSAIVKGVIRLDPKCRTIWIGDRLLATVSTKKVQLLLALLEADGAVKRSKLLEKVWGKAGQPNTLEKTIQRLREDFGPEQCFRLVTTRDGYELVG